MYLKITEREGRKVVAACDKELIGKVFSEGKAVLDLKRYSSFYQGAECNPEELGRALLNFSSANLVGKKCVGVALNKGLAAESNVKYLQGIPHLHLYKL